MAHMIDTCLRIDVGCEFKYEVGVPTPAIFMVRPDVQGGQQLLAERWSPEPPAPFHDYRDLYGNICRRMVLPAGTSSVRYAAQVVVSGELDPYRPEAAQCSAEALPDEVLI